MPDKADKAVVYDPFPSDPAIVAMGKSDKAPSFNPDVLPFTPASMPELCTWRVIAAEYTGKAVAVMYNKDAKLLVCTSPSFNSKCHHPGVPCLDWDNVKLSPAGQGSQPDSGLDNTDQSSEDREKIARVAQWSAEAARHTEEWSEDPNGLNNDWSETAPFQPQGEWTDSGQSPMWCGPQGETHLVQWSPVSMDQSQYQPQGPTGPMSPSTCNNLHITVEYHNPAPDTFSPPIGAGGHDPYSEVPLASDDHSPSTVINRVGFGNDPLFVCHPQEPNPWESQQHCPMSPNDQSWSMGLGMDFARMSLADYTGVGVKSLDNINSQVDKGEQDRKRKEFKNKILSNMGLEKDESEENKIRQDFKNQILSNLDKKDLTSTTIDTSSSAAKTDEGAKKRDEFKTQILSNLNS